jgi:hypothetical protein
MTTNIEVTCHPFLSGNQEQLEVVIETWDNGKLVRTVKGNQGDVMKHICCYEGREIRVTERVKE